MTDIHPPSQPNRPRPVPFRRPSQRAISAVLGGMLMFALIATTVAVIQMNAVPAMNERVEYGHSLAVNEDMQALSNALTAASSDGDVRTTNVEAGMQYPNRAFLVNPPAVTGTLTSSPVYGISISNAQLDQTDAVWGATDPDPFATRFLTYTPDYNEFEGASPLVYEHGILYQDTPSGDYVQNSIDIVDGRRITLYTLDGSVSHTSSVPASLTVTPLSGPATPTTVRNYDANSGMVISIPTRLSQEAWVELLADDLDGYTTDVSEMDPAVDQHTGRSIAQISYSAGSTVNTLTLTMEPGTYELRMGKAGLGTAVTPEPAEYIAVVDRDSLTAQTGEVRRVTVEVRDRYNNPVPAEEVTIGITSGAGSLVDRSGEVVTGTTQTVRTDRFGRATVYVKVFSDVTLSAQGDFDDDGQLDPGREDIEFTVDLATSGVSDGINPYDASGGLVLSNVVEESDGDYALTFTNIGDIDRTITHARLAFYYYSSPGNNEAPGPKSVILFDPADATKEVTLLSRGMFREIPNGGITVPSNSDKTLIMRFYDGEDPLLSSEFDPVNSDDFFVVSLINNGDAGAYFAFPGPTGLERLNPEANAGGPYTASDTDGSVQLDGTQSKMNSPVGTYNWEITSQTAGAGASIVDPTSATPTVTFSNVNGDQQVSLKLTVTNDRGKSDTTTTTLTIQDMDLRNRPTVDQFTVTDLSQPGAGANGYTEFQVDWSVSDVDSDLTGVRIDLIQHDGANRITRDSTGWMAQPSGPSMTGRTFVRDGDDGRTYTIRLTGRDSRGNTVVIEEVHYSDGDDAVNNNKPNP